MLMQLVPQFAQVVEINEFCSVMINVAASKGEMNQENKKTRKPKRKNRKTKKEK